MRHWLAFNRTVKETFQLQRELRKPRSPQVSGWFIDTLRKASTDIEKKEKGLKLLENQTNRKGTKLNLSAENSKVLWKR